MSRLASLLMLVSVACSSSEKPSPPPAVAAAPTPASAPIDAGPPDAAPLPPDAPAYDLSVQTFDGRPGFLVLGAHFKRHDLAERARFELGPVDAHVIDTGLFSNLRPGFFAVVYGRFDDRDAAQRHAAAVGGDVYVKQSGPVRPATPDEPAPERLTRIRGEHTTQTATRAELTLWRDDKEMARIPMRWDDQGASEKFSVWTNLTGSVEVRVSAVCPRECPQVTCRGDQLELTAAGGDVSTLAECLDWAGE